MSVTSQLVYDAKAALGEGAIWHAQKKVLYWVDIMAGLVHIYDPATGNDRTVNVGQPVGTVVPRKSGGVMVAVQHGFASLDLDTGKLNIIHDPEKHLPGSRFNDGKCDPAGRFWAGTMAMGADRTEVSGLYCMDTDHSVRPMLDKVTISNGIVWSRDNSTMYYIDTPTLVVAAFDYDLASGSISNRRVAISIPKEMGLPDGMAIDAEGMLWIAHFGGSRVTRWNPANRALLETVQVPVSNVTSCAFGGPKLDELYITTARIGLDEASLAKQPQAGGLFKARPGARGVETFAFGG